jgi:haloalkane dehalogenase
LCHQSKNLKNKIVTQFLYPPGLYPFQSKWTTVDGHRIHYIDEGEGDAILFCHPPVASSFMYRNIIKELSKNHRCIALDFPGFGLSLIAPGSNYVQSINNQAAILDGFLKNIQLQSTFFLMQECGGHAAMKVLMQQPGKLKGIIITDTIIFPVSTYPRIKTMLSLVNGSVFNFINTNFNFLIRAMTRFGIRNRKLSKEERNTYKQMFKSKETRRASTHMLHQLVIEEELLLKIQTAFETTFNKLPTLIIYGEKDPLTGMGVPRRINNLLLNSELHLIKGEGHFPHEGEPLKMCELIGSWVDRLRRAQNLRPGDNEQANFSQVG